MFDCSLGGDLLEQTETTCWVPVHKDILVGNERFTRSGWNQRPVETVGEEHHLNTTNLSFFTAHIDLHNHPGILMEPNTTKHLMILGETFGQMGFPSEYLTNQRSLGSFLWNQKSIVQTHKIISVWKEEIKKHHPIFTCLGVSPKHIISKKQPITFSAIFLQDDHQIGLIRSEIAGRIVNLLDVVSAIQSYVTLIHEFGWLI